MCFLINLIDPHPCIQKEIQMLVQYGLVLLVAETEVLQELVRERQQLVHRGVVFVVGDLELK